MLQKNYVRIYLVGVAALGILAIVLITIHHAGAQNNATNQLNQDLIQTKVELEGWQVEVSRGDLAFADYEQAFNSNLAVMKNRFENDSTQFP